MNTRADLSVHAGLEVSHLTAITHAVDDQKNRRQDKHKGRKRQPEPAAPESPEAVGDDLDDDAEKPTVDYLA